MGEDNLPSATGKKTMTWRRWGLFALLGTIGMVSACTSPLPSAEEPRTYKSILELKDDFVAAGGDCQNPTERPVYLAVAGIDCGDGYTTLVLFEDRSAAVRWGQAASELCNELVECEGGTLVGENWGINTQAPELFQDALGGTILR
jgi:hypothetical protein